MAILTASLPLPPLIHAMSETYGSYKYEKKKKYTSDET